MMKTTLKILAVLMITAGIAIAAWAMAVAWTNENTAVSSVPIEPETLDIEVKMPVTEYTAPLTLYIENTPVAEYVERWQTITITETPAPVEIIVEKPVQLQEFPNYKALCDFVKQWKQSSIIVVTTNHQCEVYAQMMQNSAANSGYLINVQITGTHAHNSAIIGNDIYFIEPQTGTIEFWGKLE